MNEFTLKLDPETRDICFDADGMLEIIDGAAVYAQNVRNNLNTWKGEFLLDETHGTDYDRILARDFGDISDDVYRESIFQEPMMAVINSLTTQRNSRDLEVSFKGELVGGKLLEMEVLKENAGKRLGFDGAGI